MGAPALEGMVEIARIRTKDSLGRQLADEDLELFVTLAQRLYRSEDLAAQGDDKYLRVYAKK